MTTDSSSSRRPGAAGSNDSESGTRSFLRRLRGFFGLRRNGDLRETLEELVSEVALGEDSAGAADERELLRNVLRLRDQTAGDVMVPRIDIVGIDLDSDLESVVSTMQKAGHSRLPVYRESLDDVVGMVHVKDVVAYWEQRAAFRLERTVREVLFAAPTMPVLDMLIEMRQKRMHLGLVVDEYGGVDGLITIEDLVEEIVGEIEDEFDAAEGTRLVRRPDGSVFAPARATIEELEDMVGPVVSDEEREESDTLGGLVVAIAGRVPHRGEVISHQSGVEFEVTDADPRRIRRLRLRNLPAAPAGDDTAS